MIAKKKSSFVPLNRRFIPWEDPKASIETASLWERTAHGRLDWAKLLEQSRVVVLAEAGSGKSEELEHQVETLAASGARVFHTTVQDLAKDGLDGALTNQGRVDLAAWKASSGEAYFFIDSIDEAKLDSIRIETAFKKLADGLDGALNRAKIIFSGRYTDWEFESDLSRLEAMLPLRDENDVADISSPELLSKLLSNEWEGRKKAVRQRPLVVLMASLDKAQVREFARAKGINDIDAFVEALDSENLWELAHRPLDLGWLVDYWQTHHRFGTLSQMLSASINQRLKETNTRLAQKDPLSEARSLEAMERVGAAMVFGRTDKVLIPDSDADAEPGEFKLENILPDWSEQHRGRLRARPVFDAATFGRIRLHNDNEGAVRSYLAALWLKRRRENGCSVEEILDLLFAETYGIALVKPSTAQTAAWLAIWDRDVARKLIAVDPALLLKMGDPGSLSPDTRAEVLNALAERVATHDEWFGWLNWPNLRRFAIPELVPTIRKLWEQHTHKDVRHLLLQLMVAGNLSECIDIATSICLGGESDRVSRVLASRLFVKFGSDEDIACYAELVRTSFKSLPTDELDEAILALFPKHLSVAEFLRIIVALANANDEGPRLKTLGPKLADKISSAAELEELLVGLVARLAPSEGIDDDNDYEESVDEKSYFPTMQGAVFRLLAVTPLDELPDVAVEATLRLNARRLYSQSPDLSALYSALHATAARRRKGMWHAFQNVDRNRFLKGEPPVNPHQLDVLGWPSGLVAADVPWLLEDALGMPSEEERRFAFVASLSVWRGIGENEAMLAQIETVANQDAKLAELLAGWRAPRVIEEWEKKHNREMKILRAKHEAERAKREKSWQQLVDDLKADPEVLRNLPARDDNNVDGRLFYFWELLNVANRGDSRYQIDDVSAVELVFGEQVCAAARDGLVAYWRGHKPTTDGQKDPEIRNSVSKLDCMGLVGISLEAAGNPAWATTLDPAAAERAAEFATIELNGFPTWFGALIAARPAEVCMVLMREIAAQLAHNAGSDHGILQDVAYASVEVARLVAPTLLEELERHPELSDKRLSTAITILVKGTEGEEARGKLLGLALDRFRESDSVDAAASYLYAVASVDAVAATDALTTRIEAMDQKSQTAFCKMVLPRVFGDRIYGGGIDPRLVPFEALERLVGIAYRTIRPDEDRERKSGEVYSLDDRDQAEGARSILYNALADTPGQATVEALRRVGPIIGMEPKHTEDIVARRAAQDSEAGAWPAAQAEAMEREFDIEPQTASDMQKVALRRIADINHDAHADDFAQGPTLKALKTEEEVQIWIGSELKARRRRAYSTERESEVVNNKRPDIRLRSGPTLSLPIEVKVAESWTLAELEKALTEQLDGRYLLHQDARHGVLLLVNQEARPKGWETPSGRWLNFQELVEHLRKMAAQRAGISHDAAKAVVAVIDVSDVFPKERRRKMATKNSANTQHSSRRRKSVSK